MKAVVAFKKSARTLRTLPFQILPVCDASSCTSPEDHQARVVRTFLRSGRAPYINQGATWWSREEQEGMRGRAGQATILHAIGMLYSP